MIDRILQGETVAEDEEAAAGLGPDERRKLFSQLISKLDEQFEEAVLFDDVVVDLSNALKQVRPVFMAGLDVDQSIGMVNKMIQASIDELEETGSADTDEYDKQVAVRDTLNRFAVACEEAGTTSGEEAFETVHLEYRGEVGRLDSLRNTAEAGMGNALAFLERAFGSDAGSEAFVKSLERSSVAMRFVGKFGSKSFFAYKHIAPPGVSYADAETAGDAEGD